MGLLGSPCALEMSQKGNVTINRRKNGRAEFFREEFLC